MTFDPIDDQIGGLDEMQYPENYTVFAFSNNHADFKFDNLDVRYDVGDDDFRLRYPHQLNPLKDFWDWLRGRGPDPATREEARRRAREEDEKAAVWESVMNAAESTRQGSSWREGERGVAAASAGAGLMAIRHRNEANRLRDLGSTLPQ